ATRSRLGVYEGPRVAGRELDAEQIRSGQSRELAATGNDVRRCLPDESPGNDELVSAHPRTIPVPRPIRRGREACAGREDEPFGSIAPSPGQAERRRSIEHWATQSRQPAQPEGLQLLHRVLAVGGGGACCGTVRDG